MSKKMFIDFRGKGFCTYDVVGAVLLKYMIDAAKEAAEQAETNWLQTVIPKWQVNAVIQDYGFFIDDDWSEAQTLVILNLIARACTMLQMRWHISAAEIQSWPILEDLRIEMRGHDSIPTAVVIRLGQTISALLQNKLEKEPALGDWVWE